MHEQHMQAHLMHDMISEAFHANYRAKVARGSRASTVAKKMKNAVSTGTSCEATEWEANTGMNVQKNFFGGKK